LEDPYAQEQDQPQYLLDDQVQRRMDTSAIMPDHRWPPITAVQLRVPRSGTRQPSTLLRSGQWPQA